MREKNHFFASMPRFCAIIPNYNDGARISASLASLFGQSRPYDEILIIDDGSTDDSPAVIERLIAGHPNARLIRSPANKGVVPTLNAGLKLVQGDYVHMASANDTYNLRLIEYCEKALAQYPDLAVICGNALFRYKESGRDRPVFMDLPQAFAYISPLAFHAKVKRSPITFFGGSIVMRHRDVMNAGGLQESLCWHTDWLVYYLLAFRSGLYFIPESLVQIEVANESYSSQAMVWSRQRDVIYALITFIAKQDEYMRQRWRSAAMLPTYNLRALGLLWRPECRWYITPLLLWRLLIHTVSYRLKYYLPRGWLIKMRKVVRV